MVLTIILALYVLTAGVGAESTAGKGVVEFPLTGDSMIYSYGLYRAEVKVGSPARAFPLQIDTGSSITWIMCSVNGTDLPYNKRYNLNNSSSVSILRCGDERCGSIFPTSRKCTAPDEPCPFSITYVDGTGSSGFYVSDTVHLDMKGPKSVKFESSANFVFGCATEFHGIFRNVGVMGLTQDRATIISQLYSQGKSSKVFSHCLSGKFYGGGFLVFGEVQGTSNIRYTPLVLTSYNYNVEVESIAVDGKKVNISQQAFVNSEGHGTFVDSGATLINLVSEAYYPITSSISSAVNLSPSTKSGHPNLQCYQGSLNSLKGKFPTVTLTMKGATSIQLHPWDYLVEDYMGFTCLGIHLSDSYNILGDVVWKDKLVVYDLQNKRIGWSSCNCSVPPNVTLTSPTESSAYNSGVGGHLLLLGIVVVAAIL